MNVIPSKSYFKPYVRLCTQGKKTQKRKKFTNTIAIVKQKYVFFLKKNGSTIKKFWMQFYFVLFFFFLRCVWICYYYWTSSIFRCSIEISTRSWWQRLCKQNHWRYQRRVFNINYVLCQCNYKYILFFIFNFHETIFFIFGFCYFYSVIYIKFEVAEEAYKFVLRPTDVPDDVFVTTHWLP